MEQNPTFEITPPTPTVTPQTEHPLTNGRVHSRQGLNWPRSFGQGDPYADINWERRTAKIVKGEGQVVFEQNDVEVPDFWSQTATDIVASKYFRGRLDSPDREWSSRQMVDRVALAIANWGLEDGYFSSRQDFENFRDDLRYILIHQIAAFNSPVWFNVGTKERPQCSACFILSIKDSMDSILEWGRQEGVIFKGGSGSGVNLSALRSSKEQLSGGGYSSGPVSFMKLGDGVANAIKSGGTTRRAAKMVVLNVDHPDIKPFIYCKQEIEKITKILQQAGVESSIEASIFDPYTLLPYQNANNSVRVTDEFMRAVINDENWDLKAVTTGEVLETVRAREIMDWIADATWNSADPGMQYDTTINRWHTCPNTGRINSSNPCSEYMHIDDSACNLASINLMKFLENDGSFNVERFNKVVDTVISAQEMLVSRSSYPTEKIAQNAEDYRQLGLGYANLGALLMSLGLPYDSDGGRAVAGAITSLMTGRAYRQSAIIAREVTGPFNGYRKNEAPMLNVLKMHQAAAQDLNKVSREGGLAKDEPLFLQAERVWDDVVQIAGEQGVRNSQATVLAPTGTISFLMDCATTGIEPELALVKYKKLVGGGTLKLVNNQVDRALKNLGYNESEVKEIGKYILETDTIEGAPGLKEEHLSVFDCSFKAQNGKRTIDYMGHLRMMGAAQPFVSGAISKTANLPEEATREDIYNAYIEAWKLGLKAIAIYRDGSKTVQPLNTKRDDAKIERKGTYTRIKLPDVRPSITHKFSVGGHEGYLTVGLYPETKKPGETFITIAREGSVVSGLIDTIATLISVSLQSGVPLATIVKKFKGMRFEPMGPTNNNDIPFASSIIDYIVTYLGQNFLSPEEKMEVFGIPYESEATEEKLDLQDLKIGSTPSVPFEKANSRVNPKFATVAETDAPPCVECGTLMVKAGACHTCPNCFATTGVCN